VDLEKVVLNCVSELKALSGERNMTLRDDVTLMYDDVTLMYDDVTLIYDDVTLMYDDVTLHMMM
jgi:hypothetical protein